MSEENDYFACLRGAYIKVIKIKRGKFTEEYSFIKLSEIKEIIPSYEDACTFKTYKDSLYFCYIPADELLKVINLYLFRQEDYYEMYGA